MLLRCLERSCDGVRIGEKLQWQEPLLMAREPIPTNPDLQPKTQPLEVPEPEPLTGTLRHRR
jgi:hypothetical protein